MPDKIIEIPNVGRIAFPESMSADDMNTAAAKLYADANKQHPKPDASHSWVDTAVDWLPSVAGAVGGIVGGIGGTVAGMGVGGVPGAVGGATLGGAAGEAAKELVNAARGKPSPTTATEAAKNMGVQGAIQGGSELVGAGVGKAMSTLAPRIMQSTLKPGIKAITKGIRGGEAVPQVVQTLLDEGINVTPGGVSKLQRILDATNEELTDAIKGSPALIDPKRAAAQVLPVAQRFSEQVDPLADLTKIGSTVENFLNHPTLGPKTGLSVAEAQKLKVGTYRLLKAKYGQLGAAGVEAEKALARGLKDEIAAEVPQVSALNAREGRVLEALDAVGKRAAMSNNRDPIGFAWAAHNPTTFIAALIDRNPTVKSLIARGMYSNAATVARVSPQVLRAAIVALTTGAPDLEPASASGGSSARPPTP